MYILETNLLLVGDIILTARDALGSKAIRKATGGRFSHAMLYVADHSYIHSDPDGVHSGNTQRLLFAADDHSAVLRLSSVNSSVIIERACIFARTQIGTQYSVPEAARSKFRRVSDKADDSNRQFCSRLVAQAYSSAGLNLVSNPNYCYPSDFCASPLLAPVVKTLRKATSEEVEFAKTESPLERQARATNYILTEIRALSGLDIQNFDQIPSFVMGNPEYDEAVCEIVRSSGYLDFWKVDVLRNPWRYDLEKFMRLPIPNDDRIQLATKELAGAQGQLNQFMFMHDQYMSLWIKIQLEYFRSELDLYRNLVAMAKQRVETAQHVIAASAK